MTVFIVNKDGDPLMPTTNIRKVRKLIRAKKARIICHHPFAVQLLYETTNGKQDIEFTEDTGYETVGVSLKSEKHEYLSAEYKMLTNEKKHHEDQVREHRRPRRNRKRYRKARFDNRKYEKGMLAPSLEHKKNIHVDLYVRYAKVCPVTKVIIECGQFDTQLLTAIEAGEPLPEGKGYQHGARYLMDTLREAVFARDNYTCIVCGKNVIENKLIAHVHHIGFWKDDRSNRLSNLGTVCENDHIPRNHKKKGKLWGLEPVTKKMSAPAFMNTVKWFLYNELCAMIDTSITYGVKTKRERLNRNIAKTHANDAYCIGQFHPKHRAHTVYYEKRRRNNRILEKFHDASYIDIRDGKKKKAGELGCNRPKRSIPRNNPNNERIYRGEKKSKGRRSIRRDRYQIQPGTVCIFARKKYVSKGCQHYGEYVTFADRDALKTTDVKVICQPGGWIKVKEGR